MRTLNEVGQSREARAFAARLSGPERLIFGMYLMINRGTLQINSKYNTQLVRDWLDEAESVLNKAHDSYGK